MPARSGPSTEAFQLLPPQRSINFRGRDRQIADADSNRVGYSVGYGRCHRNARCLADAANVVRAFAVFGLQDYRLEWRHVRYSRHLVVAERQRRHAAIFDHQLLHERVAQAVLKTAVYLALVAQWIQDDARIMGGGELQ